MSSTWEPRKATVTTKSVFQELINFIDKNGEQHPKKHGSWVIYRIPSSDQFFQLDTWNSSVTLKQGTGEPNYHVGFDGRKVLQIGFDFGEFETQLSIVEMSALLRCAQNGKEYSAIEHGGVSFLNGQGSTSAATAFPDEMNKIKEALIAVITKAGLPVGLETDYDDSSSGCVIEKDGIAYGTGECRDRSVKMTELSLVDLALLAECGLRGKELERLRPQQQELAL